MNSETRVEEKIRYVLPLDDIEATLSRVGGKGASLARLVTAGLPVPDGFHVTTDAYRAVVAYNELDVALQAALEGVDFARPASLEAASGRIAALFTAAETPPDVVQAIRQAYADLPGSNPVVAVRSSATVEDLPEASFAGQQETYLNIRSADALLKAVKKCWASLWTARAIGYRARQGIAPEQVALAVVVQLLVPAEAAGILFTANPVTGRRDQMVISAAWGLGEAVVGGLVTPDNLVVDKESGQMLVRDIADKEVMTVRVDEGTEEKAVPDHQRRAPVLSDAAVAELVQLGVQIETLYGMPMDVEWALSDRRFAIVQARPITALPEPEPVLPDEWKLPEGTYIAMRNNIVELMADPLSPLFATLGVQAVNRSMGRTLATFFGRSDMMPEDLIIVVNHYAYYNGSLSAGQMARIFLSSVGVARRMFSGAVARWTGVGRPRYVATVQSWKAESWCQLPESEILVAVRELTEAAIDAYGTLVSGVIPAAWISEALFTLVHKIVVRGDDVPAQTYLMGFDSIPLRAEKSLYDLARWARSRQPLATCLEHTPAQQLASELEGDQVPEGVPVNDWYEWQARFESHLQQYGYTIYNLDFANPVPADRPAPLLEACKHYLQGGGVDPSARQQATVERREEATAKIEQRLRGVRLRLFRNFLAPAQRFAPLREDALAEVGLAYPLLREMLLELGQRLARRGLIEAPGDIFWLEQDEVEVALNQEDQTLPPMAELVRQRQAIQRAAGRLTPPFTLMRMLGIDFKQRKRSIARDGERLKGVACSPGQVTAPARVLRGAEDFDQMQPGDVLVAPITTPAWTSLFALASAIVTDVGGPLSHGSIIAREYGIPAVLGTGVASRQIRSGQQITVDGSAGEVILMPDNRP